MASSDVQDQESNDVSLAGSVFVNNTSYAGCDIKVVVNLYDAGAGAQAQIDEMVQELKDTQEELDELTRTVTGNQQRLAGFKPGTQEFRFLSDTVNLQISRIITLGTMIQSMENQLLAVRRNQPQASAETLAEVQTLAVSVHRDKTAVRSCGSVYPKAFTRGPREIAGSLIFTVFNQHVLHRFLEAEASDFDANKGITSALMDQLPPVDITVAFANEYGSTSRMTVYGVEFVNEGQTMSVEDLLTENVVSFVARDLDPMRSVSQRKIDQESKIMTHEVAMRASDLILEDDYQDFKDMLSPFSRFSKRRNPFL